MRMPWGLPASYGEEPGHPAAIPPQSAVIGLVRGVFLVRGASWHVAFLGV